LSGVRSSCDRVEELVLHLAHTFGGRPGGALAFEQRLALLVEQLEVTGLFKQCLFGTLAR
jgi:hypothetical protein